MKKTAQQNVVASRKARRILRSESLRRLMEAASIRPSTNPYQLTVDSTAIFISLPNGYRKSRTNLNYRITDVLFFFARKSMPTISMFFGIIIQLFFFDDEKHRKPHVHARYNEFKASIDIETAEILEEEIPQRQLRLVQAWIEIHRDELMADWALAVDGDSPFKIEPLK